MTGTLGTRLACAAALALITVAGSAVPSVADTVDFPAGVACVFDLRVDISPNPNRVSREFVDKNGNVVRKLTAGKGDTLAFTNLSTGAMLVLRPNGSVEHITVNPDGSNTEVTTGHDVLILFPTDVPAGPSTTLYVGRLVFTIDPNEVFTLQSFTGTSTDICAALSS